MLEAEGLYLDFPGGAFQKGKDSTGRSLFRGLTLKLHRGEVLSLLGPSGCGKSSLLRILMGLVAPTRGRVTGLSQDFSAVFQEPRLLPWRNVAENLRLPLELKSKIPQKNELENLLRRVKLGDEVLHLRPDQLSGGMKMRVALARSLATAPDCLFLDEPFSALDERTRFELQDLLVSLLGSGLSAVFVTHSISEAVYVSDRILILSQDGEIKDQYIKPDSLKNRKDLRSSLDYFEAVKDLSSRFEKSVEAQLTAPHPVHA